MRKFLYRPAVALAVILAVIFVLILIQTYVNVVRHFTTRSFAKENVQTLFKESKIRLPFVPFTHIEHTEAVTNIATTLGTFDALNVTCFSAGELMFNKTDKFLDLQKVVRKLKFSHVLDDNDDDDFSDDDFSEDTLDYFLDISSSSSENTLIKFHRKINRYQLCPKNSKVCDDLLYDMSTQALNRIDEMEEGTQFKLKVQFGNDISAIFKPMRTTREQQALPNQFYFAEYERHTSEIAAYHLDRVLGFNKTPPVVGRNVNMIVELLRIAKPSFQKTFYISPKPDENLCFTGNCVQYCDSSHPICGQGYMIEGSFMALFPSVDEAERTINEHPWSQSWDPNKDAPWESNVNYCKEVFEEPEFSKGRLPLELIEMSIFDFLIGNMDRRNYQTFEAFGKDTFTLRYDHGRAFGRAFHDELKILAPLLQCCVIRLSNLQTLLDIHNSDTPLSARMRKSLSKDPLTPILWEPHLEALDRRLMIVLQAVRDCINRYSVDEVINIKDTL